MKNETTSKMWSVFVRQRQLQSLTQILCQFKTSEHDILCSNDNGTAPNHEEWPCSIYDIINADIDLAAIYKLVSTLANEKICEIEAEVEAIFEEESCKN